MDAKKKKLGKGLGALLKTAPDKDLFTCRIEDILVNENQPRKKFDEEKLRELADSIKQYGIIQPIVVKKEGTKYRIVAGERRFRAALMIGMNEIRVILFRGEEDYQVALIENLQREDLNPIEIAEAYAELIKRFNYTQQELSDKVGKSRSDISNYLRLLNLSGKIKDLMRSAKITVGQVRPLTVLEKEEQEMLLERIINSNLNAREVEKLVKQKKKPTPPKVKSNEYKHLESEISENTAAKVKIKKKTRKIAITFEFTRIQEFNKFVNEFKK